METTASFDLNPAIHNWRENLAQSPAFRSENLDELESHLRDSIATLQTRGLSAEEAFLIATRRVGKGGALETEFQKVNRHAVWLDRVLWMLIGIQVWGLTSGLIMSLTRNAFAFGWRSVHYDWKTNGMALPVVLFIFISVVSFAASIAACWWLIFRKGGKVFFRFAPWLQRRKTFIVTCLALCLIVLCINVFSSSLPALLFWAYGKEVVGEAMMYASYSQLWVSPFEIAAMIAATMVLARKRLQFVKA